MVLLALVVSLLACFFLAVPLSADEDIDSDLGGTIIWLDGFGVDRIPTYTRSEGVRSTDAAYRGSWGYMFVSTWQDGGDGMFELLRFRDGTGRETTHIVSAWVKPKSNVANFRLRLQNMSCIGPSGNRWLYGSWVELNVERQEICWLQGPLRIECQSMAIPKGVWGRLFMKINFSTKTLVKVGYGGTTIKLNVPTGDTGVGCEDANQTALQLWPATTTRQRWDIDNFRIAEQ